MHRYKISLMDTIHSWGFSLPSLMSSRLCKAAEEASSVCSLLKHVANICYAKATFMLNASGGGQRGRGPGVMLVESHVSVSIMLIGICQPPSHPSCNTLSNAQSFIHAVYLTWRLCKISINAFAVPRPPPYSTIFPYLQELISIGNLMLCSALSGPNAPFPRRTPLN